MIYQGPRYDDNGRCTEVSNDLEIAEFIGENVYECPTCEGTGETEGEYGPTACYPCVAGWPLIVDHTGKVRMVQYGDTLERHSDGLHWLEGSMSLRCQDCDYAVIAPRSQANDLMDEHTMAMFHRRRR